MSETPSAQKQEHPAEDVFVPKPLILCPISAHKIEAWSGVDMPRRGLKWTEKSPQPTPLEGSTAPVDATETIAQSDFRIRTMSPDPVQAHIQITVHCFVQDGVWTGSEICEVKNIQTGYVIYSTEEDPLRRAVIEHYEKKRKAAHKET